MHAGLDIQNHKQDGQVGEQVVAFVRSAFACRVCLMVAHLAWVQLLVEEVQADEYPKMQEALLAGTR